MRYLLLFVAGSILGTGAVIRHEVRNGRHRARIVVLFLGAVAVALAWGVGNVLLGTVGLSWRRWLESAYFVLLTIFLLGGFGCAFHSFMKGPKGNLWSAAAGVVTCAVLCLCLAGICVLRGLVNGWTDRVELFEGQKVVVETEGVFHEVGYRYVNLFMHGEQKFERQD